MNDVQKLDALRQHHEREAQRCADAIELLKQIGKLSKKAARVTGAVRARAGRPRRGSGVRTRVVGKVKITKPLGSKPIDHVRAMLRDAGENPIPVADIQAVTQAPRLGVILGGMKRRREIRMKGDQVTAWKLPAAVSANGASAEG